MTKEQLIKASGIDATKLDSAMPQTFLDKCYDIGLDPLALFVGWYYGDTLHGRPLPMAELWALAHANIYKPMLTFAKKMAETGAKGCPTCEGHGEIPTNTFDEPPEPCHKCASLHMVILDCEKGIGNAK